MLKTSYSGYVETNHTYCVTKLYLHHISIVSCRQKEFCLVVALSVRLLGLAPWTDTYPDGIAQPWIRCSNIEIGNGIEGDMLTRSRCWKRDSPTSLLIDQRGIPPLEKIHYLKRYLGGAALEAVEGFCLLTTADAYEQARNLLDDRFGDPFIVANAFRDKLDAWPNITERDGSALRKFADFLRQCNTAMQTTKSLNILNDSRENKKLLCKLPDWLVTRWSRIVVEWKQKMRSFPPFKEFMNFVVKRGRYSLRSNHLTSSTEGKQIQQTCQ